MRTAMLRRKNSILFHVIRRMRMPLITLVCVYAAAVAGFTLIPGRGPDGEEWRMSFFHAFYFVSFMGSTIGFGEIPHPFTDGQRLWTVFTIYTSVISWLYAIGTLIALMREPGLLRDLTLRRFERHVRLLRNDFFLVCGYDSTEELLVESLARQRIQCVVVERAAHRVGDLETGNLPLHVPGICADPTDAATLQSAGLGHRHCRGLISLDSDDQVNLKIAVTSKLLSPRVKVICAARNADSEKNMASFGTDVILDPFAIFARQLRTLVSRPHLYQLEKWFTADPGAPLCGLPHPPPGAGGRWVLCGFGRYGQALHAALRDLGGEVTVVAMNPANRPPPQAVFGRGTEAVTLREAEVERADGLIAGTDDDTNNLSILMTARDLNPKLFLIGRQNKPANTALFAAAGLNLVNHYSEALADDVLASLTAPLTRDFLRLLPQAVEHTLEDFAAEVRKLCRGVTPAVWRMEVARGGAIADLHPAARDDRPRPIALLLARGGRRILLPDVQTATAPGDLVLFCGAQADRFRMRFAAGESQRA